MNVCTVVISVYDQRADWLLEAINSVDRATPIVLADDGSTKYATLRVLAHFMALSDAANVRTLPLPHRGMEPTLNAAIALVDTEYVAILDSDDRRIAGSLDQQCAFLDLTPEAVAAHGRFNYMDENGAVIRPNVLHPTPCHSTLVFRKSAWETVRGYPVGFEFGQGDSAFIAKLRQLGDVSALPVLCADRRVHPASLSYPNQPRLQRIYREARRA